jgi:glutamate-1-semialdehyde aminotransferase
VTSATLTAPYGNLDVVKKLFEDNKGQVRKSCAASCVALMSMHAGGGFIPGCLSQVLTWILFLLNTCLQIAGVILEPIVGNGGFIAPSKEYLQGLRDLCTQDGALLCFDEVMTGFRVHKVRKQGAALQNFM